MTKQAYKTKEWCFTINNPTKDDAPDPKHCLYMIVSNEGGTKEVPTPHIQGYVYYKTPKRLTAVKKLMPRAHLEKALGTSEQAIHYCKKPVFGCTCKHCIKAKNQIPDYYEYGVLPLTAKQATKKRWQDARQAAKEGRFDDIPADMYTRYMHSYLRMHQRNPPKLYNLHKFKNLWITAPTGYGKSQYARETFPDFYDKSPNKWFIAYKGEKTILLDDFSPYQFEYLIWYIKRWSDKYPFPAENKGGGTTIRPIRIVVTSQYSIKQCFPDSKDCAAIKRRFRTLRLQHFRKRNRYTHMRNFKPTLKLIKLYF